MVLKSLAIELYRAKQRVTELEKRLADAALKDQDLLRRELHQALAEHDQIRRLLDARKEPPPFRRTFQDR